MARDHRDLVIAHLTGDLMSTEDQRLEALIELESYREIARQAIHELHDLTGKYRMEKASRHRLSDEYPAVAGANSPR